MKRWASSISGLFLVLAVPQGAAAQTSSSASADVAAKKVEAQAIIDVMFPPPSRNQMINKMMDDLMKPLREGFKIEELPDPGLQKLMQEMLIEATDEQRPLIAKHLPAVFEAMAGAYTREFSLDELKQVHAFATTPAGTRYFSRATAIMGDPEVQRVNAAIVADSHAVAQKMTADFKERIFAYLNAHPEVVAKMKGD